MKILLFWTLFWTLSTALAEPAKPKAPPPSQLNTQIYESEKEEASFEAVVKTVREVQGETEVLFEGKQGFFTLTNSSSQHLLVKSQKNHTPLHITVHPGNRQILKVQIKDSE